MWRGARAPVGGGTSDATLGVMTDNGRAGRTQTPEAETPEAIVARGERIAQGEGEALEAAIGAVAGAAAGIVAGPVGIAAGAAIGAAAGVALAHQMRKQAHEDAVHERELDAGVMEDLPPEAIPPAPERPSLAEVQQEMEGGVSQR